MSILLDYFGLHEGEGEQAVCCPFPHTNTAGEQYLEANPSASVNTDDPVMHCKVCNTGWSESSFIRDKLLATPNHSIRLAHMFKTDETLRKWKATPMTDVVELAESLGISAEVARALHVAGDPDEPGMIMFPVFMYNKLLDIRKYTPNGKPKVRGRRGGMNGLIIPYDIWRSDGRTTYICAGEKDMAVARSHGFNAITLTGGEMAAPVIYSEFIGRNIVILYDNDPTGIQGGVRLADLLAPYAKNVKVCTNFHNVCKETGEDITDFFVKYGKTAKDLQDYVKTTPLHQAKPEKETTEEYPYVSLVEATAPAYVGNHVRSNIQVVATSEAAYLCAAHIKAIRLDEAEDPSEMQRGEMYEWILTPDNIEDVLHITDNSFTEATIYKNYARLTRTSQYKHIRYIVEEYATLYKSTVTDMLETKDAATVPMEFTCYTLNERLLSGTKYLAVYKLAPHPYRGQQLTMLCHHTESALDSVSQFRVNKETIPLLKAFQSEDPIPQRMHRFSEKFKGILNYNGNNQLIEIIDLAFHTPIKFHFGRYEDVRGYLETLIIGESRVGKSSTADAMRETYGLGTFVSLAGNAATIAGLVGGSNKVNGNMQTRAGVIPQNHRGLIIFEELSKSKQEVLGELTDIRSSNEVRITRVAGTLTLPAFVRMITLSNTSTAAGFTRAVDSYPNGIAITTELIGTAEDVARYDIIYILSERANNPIDPRWTPDDPFTLEEYRARIRWVWSRTPEQIMFTDTAMQEVVDQSNRLVKEYDSHIKIFGTESWKKICRLAIAAAGLTVSTDETYTTIQVTKAHVTYAAKTLESLYDNTTFRFKEYCEAERRFTEIDDEGVALLQSIFDKQPALILHLEQEISTSRAAIQSATGMNMDEYNSTMNRMVMGSFIQFDRNDIIPSKRFRLGSTRLNRKSYVKGLGENATG